MKDVIFQTRKYKGKFSVIARVWNPQKEFYEHPTLIDLSDDEATAKCYDLIEHPVSKDEIIKTWNFIGS